MARAASAYFATVAGEWDEMRAGYFTEAMRDDAIARAQLPAGAVVADIGTGTGFVLAALAPLASVAYGFDESPEMLAVARRNLSGYSNVLLEQAAGAKLPLPDGVLHGVFANMYLHHAPEPGKAIVEMARLLRPGGVLCITDLDIHDRVEQRTHMADRWLGFEREQIRRWYSAANLAAIDISAAAGMCCATNTDDEDYALSVFVALGRMPA
ncbi:MAG: class I SAM-dependent methyltransferase [Anaerolineales bacterium]